VWAALVLKFEQLSPAVQSHFSDFIVAVTSALTLSILGLYRALG
jgi:hypothetical protein